MSKKQFDGSRQWPIWVLWFVVVVTAIYSCFAMRNNAIRNTDETMKNLMVNTSLQVHQHISETLRLMEKIASRVSQESIADPEKSVEELEPFRISNNLRNLSVAALDGTSWIATGESINLANRDYFEKAVAGESAVTNMVFTLTDGNAIGVYAVPITRNEQVVAVLWCSVPASDLYKQLGLAGMEHYGEVFIMDSEGNVVAQIKVEEVNFYNYVMQMDRKNLTEMQAMQQDIAQGRSNTRGMNLRQGDIRVYYYPIGVEDWWMVAEVPVSTVQKVSMEQIQVVVIASVVMLVTVTITCQQIIKQSRKMARQLAHQLETDQLTGGYNDVYMRQNLPKVLQAEPDTKFVMLDFKINNLDALVKLEGLEETNQRLRNLHKAIQATLQPGEILVHHFFGSFMLLKRYDSMEQTLNCVERLSSLDSGAKMQFGIYRIEPGMEDFDTICMYTTVARGHLEENTNYGIYSNKLYQKDLEQDRLERAIQRGVEEKEFRAWFQPKYSADGSKLVGAEALVRWYQGDTVVAPYAFIPLAEQTGQIMDIDLCVLEDVCCQIRHWLDEKKQVVPVSVNMSRNYLDSDEFLKRIWTIVEKWQVPTRLLEFEITETSLEGNEQNLRRAISALHDMGFTVALDDFGTGYSSLKNLISMEFDTIKIDKVFVDGIGLQKWNNAVDYSVSLGKKLNAMIVAEGAETKEQCEYLQQKGCDAIQGYYFSKPLPKEEFEQLMD